MDQNQIYNEYGELEDWVVTTNADKFGQGLPPWETGDVRFQISRIDLAYDEPPFGRCGHCWNGTLSLWARHCGSDVEDMWIDYLRSQEVYPLPVLAKKLVNSARVAEWQTHRT